ncbi:hypothetical protein LY28_02706 [Ruminiclostridium sufflavum DSM 19573]|uniref:Uncharacterized protein n=1 Tax=Ruminiclostridium sufflavum DSM 19573 TaxID=1121337 RepID=A0A318XLN2_9FIRM|nr:hypothetical protein [Ruminiclostridium sufflavum]PYG86882.1 hypothetical protein LY28_02706 [Ruminiclostridium sufflavum DSM 19573]
MLEYCKCGSLMINGSCTHKGCSNNLASQAKAKATRAKASAIKKPVKAAASTAAGTPAKSTKVPRASKCITYKLSDLPQIEE